MRDKLIELIENGLACPDDKGPFGDDCDTCRYMSSKNCVNERVADYLIANGVTFAEPVKHGVWEMTEDDYMGLWLMRCSLCNEEWCFEGKEEGIDMQLANYNYCPNCGAKMERIKDNDTC